MSAFDEVAPLPRPVDPFAVSDAEERLVAHRLASAGGSEESARALVRALLRQIALGWGLVLPPGNLPPGPVEAPPGFFTVEDAMELRRAHRAMPLELYGSLEKVRWRDEDGRWIFGMTQGCDERGLRLLVARGNEDYRPVVVTDPARVQPAG